MNPTSTIWTVLGDDYGVHPEAHGYLESLQLGSDSSPNTARQYATSLALFLTWAAERGYGLLEAARNLDLFINSLLTEPIASGRRSAGRPRSGTTIANTLAAVRSFYLWAVAAEQVDARALTVLWRGDRGGAGRGPLPQHRVRRTTHRGDPKHLPFSEVMKLLDAAGSARDRLMIILFSVLGLRLGQALGLRRGDLHLVEDASAAELLDPTFGETTVCRVPGPHLHVVRRLDNPNGALSKARHTYAVPVPLQVLGAFDDYYVERAKRCPGRDNDMFMINLGSVSAGSAMTPRRAQAIVTEMARRAGTTHVHPHMLRHSMATTARDLGVQLDDIQALLGHLSPLSTNIYAHVSDARKAAAVDRVAAFMTTLRLDSE